MEFVLLKRSEFGCVFFFLGGGGGGGKSKSGFPNPKTEFAFFGANQKTDHESIKSKL